jgi:hypothetical protein
MIMAYNYKDVFYLSAQTETANGTYNSAGVEGVIPLDVSAYVDPIARGKSKGTGLAIYRVHMDASSTTQGRPISIAEDGQMRVGMTVKEYTTTGHGATSIGGDQLTCSSDLLAWGMDFCGSTNASPSTTNVTVNSLPDEHWFLLPSDEVPYIVVRDSLNWLFTSQAALNASIYWSIRLECAQVTLDTNTLNQLLRTQTA